MTSDKQLEANQQNAQRSTGPRTPEGKSIVARNTTRYGILSEQIPLNDVEFDLYTEFREAMLSELQPKDGFQHFLADRIISTAWRLRRIVHVETLMLQKAEAMSYFSTSYQGAFEGCSANYMAILARYERSLENALFRALRELNLLQQPSKEVELCDPENGFVS